MQISFFALTVLVMITLISSVGFTIITNGLIEVTLGRPARFATRAIWVILPLIVQLALVFWAFHPISYIVILAIICLLEWVTIRRPKGRSVEKMEKPVTRFASWIYFSFWPLVGLFLSATTVKGAWELNGKTIFLYLLAPLAVIAVGLIRVLICGPSPKPAEAEKTDDQPIDVEEDDLDEDELDDDVGEDTDEDDDDLEDDGILDEEADIDEEVA